MTAHDVAYPPLTLRIAVTGHRNFDDPAKAQLIQRRIEMAFQLCDRALSRVKNAEPELFSNRKEPMPVLAFVSALAQGSDQIAVSAFRDVAISADIRKRLEVIIPFGIEDYARTMSPVPAEAMRQITGYNESSSAHTARADRVLVLQDRKLGENLDDPEERRFMEQRYANLGDMLIRQADVLISVWDGHGKRGAGTSYVTALALRQGLPVLWINPANCELRLITAPTTFGDVLADARNHALLFPEQPSAGPSQADSAFIEVMKVALLPSKPGLANAGEGESEHKIRQDRASLESYFGIGGRKPDPAPPRTWFTSYKHLLWLSGSDIQVSNYSIETLDQHPVRSWAISQLRLFTIKCDAVQDMLKNASPPDKNKLSLNECIGAPWARADAIATRMGHIYRSNYLHIFSLGAIAVLIALFGGLNEEYKAILLKLELIMLLYAAGVYWCSQKLKIHERFLDARGIAEELRVTWALSQIGIGGRKPTNSAAPWAVWAARSWIANVGLPDAALDRSELNEISGKIRSFIVLDQKKYHVETALRMSLFHHALERAGFFAFIVACVAGAAYLFATGILDFHPSPVIAKCVVFAGVGLPVIAATIAGIRYQGDFHRLSGRAEKTARELQWIEDALLAFENKLAAAVSTFDAYAELRDIFLELEKILSADLNDWRFVYRARPTPEPG